MFQHIQVGDEVSINAANYQVARVSPSRFWAQVGDEQVKFNKANGREYGGVRLAQLVAGDRVESDGPVNMVCEAEARQMSLADLLAGVLQTPDANRLALDLLRSFDSLTRLRRATVAELARALGSVDLAYRLKSAIEFSRRLLTAQDVDRPRITSPADAANLVMDAMRDLKEEHMRLLLLDTRNTVMASPTIYTGSLNTISVRLGDIFRHAVERGAASIIVVHNHPSGDPSPSPEDVNITRNLVAAGKLMDISVLDHLVIGDGRYVSLKERNLGFD